jgi:hypothetical protein
LAVSVLGTASKQAKELVAIGQHEPLPLGGS